MTNERSTMSNECASKIPSMEHAEIVRAWIAAISLLAGGNEVWRIS
jgi:hypothetical protein